MGAPEANKLGVIIPFSPHFSLEQPVSFSTQLPEVRSPLVTECMIDAGLDALIEYRGRDDSVALVSAIYRAMRDQSQE